MGKDEGPSGEKKSNLIPVLGLLLAAITAAAGFFLFLSGPQIRVSDPDYVLIYRTGPEPDALLAFALPLEMSNWSQGYGDRLEAAVLRTDRISLPVRLSGTRNLAFTNRPSRVCERESADCVEWQKLAVVDVANDNMLIKAGEPSPRTLGFEVLCPPGAARCDAASYAHVLRALGSGPVTLSVTLQFERDGTRVLSCTVEKIHGDYIQRTGWQGAECKNSRVTGNHLF
jgi:hypothetical protein